MKMYKSKEVDIYKDIFRKGQRDKIQTLINKALTNIIFGDENFI